jgi:WD40 repeat protein
VFNVHKRGDVVASAEDCCVRIWDLARRTCERTLSCNVSGGHRMVLGVWLSEDQQTVLSGGADGDIKVWDIQKGTCGRVLTGHAGPVVTLKANETQIVSTSFDGSCRVWSWRGRCEQTLLGHRGHVCGLSFQPNDPANVWTGADDGLVKCWDMETARCLATLAPEREQHGSVWCVEAGTSALLTGATDASVRIWDMSSRREVARLDGHREAVAGLQSDERRILTSAFDGTLRIWDWRNTAQCLGVVQARARARARIYARANARGA